MFKCLWNGWKWYSGVKEMPSLYNFIPMILKWLWQKTQIEKILDHFPLIGGAPLTFISHISWRRINSTKFQNPCYIDLLNNWFMSKKSFFILSNFYTLFGFPIFFKGKDFSLKFSVSIVNPEHGFYKEQMSDYSIMSYMVKWSQKQHSVCQRQHIKQLDVNLEIYR